MNWEGLCVYSMQHRWGDRYIFFYLETSWHSFVFASGRGTTYSLIGLVMNHPPPGWLWLWLYYLTPFQSLIHSFIRSFLIHTPRYGVNKRNYWLSGFRSQLSLSERAFWNLDECHKIRRTYTYTYTYTYICMCIHNSAINSLKHACLYRVWIHLLKFFYITRVAYKRTV